MAKKKRSRKTGKPRKQSSRKLPWRRWLGYCVLAIIVIPIVLIGPLRWIDPPFSSFMLATRAAEVSRGGTGVIHYQWVDYQHISPAMPLAAIAGEDQDFPFHHGFDWSAIGDALYDNVFGDGPLRGASTISQQVVKNLFLWDSRNLLRKGIEAYLTAWLELLWPKQRILEVYLNIAQMGPTTFGVGAASRQYFGIAPRQLRPWQAARLIAILPAPDRYNPAHPGRYVRERAAWIVGQMRNLGYAYLRNIQGKTGH